MAGSILSNETEVYVFASTGAQPAKAGTAYTFAELMGTLIDADNEVACDPPPQLSASSTPFSGTPVGRKRAIVAPGAAVPGEAILPVWLARTAGRTVTAEQATVARALMDLADGVEFNLGVLFQVPGATAAENVVRADDGSLTVPGANDIENVTVRYIRATKGFSSESIGGGGWNLYNLAFTPGETSNLIDKP